MGEIMNCPLCNIHLIISERQGIEIDYCPQCRGVWLDRGELDMIIERCLSISASQQHQGEQMENSEAEVVHYYDKDYELDVLLHKKKRNFIKDLFDFSE